jgi:hypothetical protein
MPFLMEPEVAARIIVDGVAAGRRVIRFPWPTSALVSLASHLPGRLYEQLASRSARGTTAKGQTV